MDGVEVMELNRMTAKGISWGRSRLFDLVKRLIRLRFPTVQRMTTTDLAEWIDSASGRSLLLLDTRTPDEYAVSHLHQAHWLDPDKPDLVAHIPASPGDRIVVYCSIGYRSAKVTQKLQQAGFTQVYNLEGSLFQWANEDRPLFQGDRVVQQVHPYNGAWGNLLKPQYRAIIR